MEFLKNLWLKIIACICCTQDHEIPNKEQQAFAESQEQKTELPNEKNDHENIPEDDSKRMFNGALSTKVQGQLFIGIAESNHIKIKDAIEHGADINTTINGLDPLQYAITNGKEYIIEFLLQSGAKIKEHHIKLAEGYQWIYESNLKDNDMVFHQEKDPKTVLEEHIDQYNRIATILKQERAHQQQQNTKPQVNNTPAASAAKPILKNSTQQDIQTTQEQLSTKPKIVTFASAASAAAAKSSAQNDDKL